MYIADCKNLFSVLRPAKHKRRCHNPKELIFFNALTDALITSWKTRVEVANSGKTMTFYESIRAFPKVSENSRFRKLLFSIIRTTDYSKDSCGPWHFELTVFCFMGVGAILEK